MILERFHWTLFLAWHTRGQARIPYQPRSQLIAAQTANLRRMVRHATRTVPHYQRFFRGSNLRPEDIRGADDLARLPLIGRANLQSVLDDFASRRIKPDQRYEMRTSGSVGMPVTLWHDHASMMRNMVHGERERAVLAHFVGRAYGYRQATILHPSGGARRAWAFYRQKSVVPAGVRPRRLVLSTLDPIEHNIAQLNAFQPDVLSGFGTHLGVFLRHLAAERPDFHRPRVILYAGAHLSLSARRFAEEELGTPVVSIYNSCESTQMGFMCEERNGFHMHIDLCPVRIVDREGGTLGPGEAGEVVLSNLVNRATVLLNYRLGDRAKWLDGACPCGRSLPRIELLAGRTDDYFRLSDGSLLDSQQVRKVLDKQQAVFQFQLIQETLDSLRILLVAAGDSQEVEPALRDDLTELLGPAVSVELEFVDAIPVPARGKFQAVRSLVDNVS